MKRKRPPTTVATNGPPDDVPAVLYAGTVMHARLKPVSHRFAYRVFNLLIDIDKLREADGLSRIFSVGRFNLVSFDEKDHGLRDGSPLRPYVDDLLRESGIAERAERILLLCYPRILGYVFNPLSVYYAYGKGHQPIALVYEVRNTFGDIHTYVEPVVAGQAGPHGIRQSRRKAFYVSPFMDMDRQYRFRILPPGEAVRVRILESDADGPELAASFAGERLPLTSRALTALCATIPLLTLKVIAAIHFEALRLWMKRAPFFPPSKRNRLEINPADITVHRKPQLVSDET